MKQTATLPTEKTKMTVSELFNSGVEALKKHGIEDPEFDARCMLEEVLNFDTTKFLLHRSDTVCVATESDFCQMLQRRIDGEPLQYILGKWEFMGFPFYVGEGVLIPRPETEMLVEFSADFLKDKSAPVVLDLCSGSGCIAVSVAKLLKNSKVFAVEKSEKAFNFLKKNIELNKAHNVQPVLGDVFDNNLLAEIEPDLILSNPPYIRSQDIGQLQREVQREPRAALDGGKDGYIFYRHICSVWLKRLKKGGAIALECAEDQTCEIAKMLSPSASNVSIARDLNGLPRTVSAIK